MTPFENILGNTPKLRIIDRMLPLDNIYFTKTEICQIADISKQKIDQAITELSNDNIIKSKIIDNELQYTLNFDNPIITSIQDFNFHVIDKLYEDIK
jgi:hypothetical protein